MAFLRNNAVCITDCNAFVDLLDSGEFRIYDDTGTVPTYCEDGNNTNVLLATIDFGLTAFGAAADQAPGAMATANATTDETASVAGTAAYWRLYTSGGTCIGQGLPADLTFTSTTIPGSSTVGFSAEMTVTFPES